MIEHKSEWCLLDSSGRPLRKEEKHQLKKATHRLFGKKKIRRFSLWMSIIGGLLAIFAFIDDRLTIINSKPSQVEKALSTLEMIRMTLPSNENGQAKAIRTLARKGKSLTGMDFQNFYLSNQKFRKISIAESNLSGATIERSCFDNAIFLEAKLDFVEAKGVSMHHANLQRSYQAFAEYDEAELEGATFDRANLMYATFRGADLTGVSFRFANLTYADFSGSNVENTDFSGAILNGAVFEGVKNVSRAKFADTSITNAVALTQRTFKDEEVCGCIISGYRGRNDSIYLETKTGDTISEKAYRYWTPAYKEGYAHAFFLRPCPILKESELPVGLTVEKKENYLYYRPLINVSRTISFNASLLAKRQLQKRIVERLENRNIEAIESIRYGDLVLPNTEKDRSYVELFSALLDSVSSISSPMVFGLGSDYFSLGLLNSIGGDSLHIKNLWMDEIVEEVIRSFNGENNLAAATAQGITIDAKAILPFGKLHVGNQDLDSKSIFDIPIRFGPKAASAYLEWRGKMFPRISPTLYFMNYNIWSIRGTNLSYARDYEELPLRYNRAIDYFEQLEEKPTIFSNIMGYGVGFYLDTLPEELADAKMGLTVDFVKSPLSNGEMLQIILAIDSVKVVEDAQVILVEAHVNASKRVKVWKEFDNLAQP